MVLTMKRAAVFALLLVVQSAGAQSGGRARGGGGILGSGDFNFVSRRPVLFGFALECVDCQPTGGRGGYPAGRGAGDGYAWTYTSYPRVAAVIPGSVAEAAGIQAGDILMSIEGLSLLTAEGTKKFASAVSGDEVHLGFERASKPINVALTLGRAARVQGRGGPTQTFDVLNARYVGAYGNVDLDVWSDEPVSVTRDSTGAMILRTGTTVVRLRADGITDSAGVRRRARAGGADGAARGRGRGGPPY
jgi:membrane-associated protease RseP (regulator of RpoE activity)